MVAGGGRVLTKHRQHVAQFADMLTGGSSCGMDMVGLMWPRGYRCPMPMMQFLASVALPMLPHG